MSDSRGDRYVRTESPQTVVCPDCRMDPCYCDTIVDEDYGDGLEPNCQTCLGDGIEECEDSNSSEGCWQADCNGDFHTCPNCRGSGRAKDQWYW